MSRSFPRAARRATAGLAAALMLVIGVLGDPAAAEPDAASTPENYTFSATRTVDIKDTADVSDDITTYRYTLVLAPTATQGNGISHALFSQFCVTPIGYAASQFLTKDGSTADVGLKRESIKVGDWFSFDFAGVLPEDPFGATIIIKQGDASRTIDLAGPACPGSQTPVPCPAGEMPPVAGGTVTNPDDCVPIPCPAGRELPAGAVPADADMDREADSCVLPTVCPLGQQMVDGVCTTPTVPVIEIPVVNATTCPDGTTMTDADGDGELTAVDCVTVLPSPGVVPATPAQPGTPSQPAIPAVPAQPAPEVLPATATPSVVPVVAPAPAPEPAANAVLGAQVTRAPLARTGSSSTGLAAFGALLVLLGASATVAGRRTARS